MIAFREHRPARPEWVDDELLAKTVDVWSRIYGRSLTSAEAIEILLNFGRLIDAIEEQS